jgi:hypothetical protein
MVAIEVKTYSGELEESCKTDAYKIFCLILG